MCADDNKWYIGNILEVSKEFGDVFVYFMKTEGKVSHGHQKKDQWWVPTVNVICIITTFFKMLKNLKILVDLKI